MDVLSSKQRMAMLMWAYQDMTAEEVDEAAKPLYKLLSAEQKASFDSKVPTFINATQKRLTPSQPNYNLPELGGSPSPNQSSGSGTLPGYIHQ